MGAAARLIGTDVIGANDLTPLFRYEHGLFGGRPKGQGIGLGYVRVDCICITRPKYRQQQGYKRRIILGRFWTNCGLGFSVHVAQMATPRPKAQDGSLL